MMGEPPGMHHSTATPNLEDTGAVSASHSHGDDADDTSNTPMAALAETALAETGEPGLVPVEVLIEPEVVLPHRPLRRAIAWVGSTILSCVGAVTLTIVLAVLATLPIVQFLSLGYLLEVSGRVVRTGRLRSGFIGLKPAGIAGLLAIAIFLAWLPLRLASGVAASGRILAVGSPNATAWSAGVLIGLAGLGVCLFIAFGVLQLLRPRTYSELRDGVWRLTTQRAPYYFWLGARGFFGGMVWLAIPITLLVMASILPNAGQGPMQVLAGILRLVGGVLLAVVVVYLPFLQTQFAAENRFGAMFELGAVRRRFRRAPVAFLVALAIALVFAAPLYLLKVELVPRDAAWLPSLLFVMFMFPARLLFGWAYSRSGRRETSRHWFFRVTARLGMIPLAVLYVVFVFFSQFTGWHGVWGMYEQHAFLLPVPFLGL